MERFFLHRAAAVINSGGVIAYPTEAVFGLGCDPFDELAVARILAIKQRSSNKGLILVASDLQQLEACIAPLSAQQQREIASATEPTSWVVPAHPSLPWYVSGAHQGVAIRLIAHPLIKRLCELLDGPIVSTSANHQGRTPARTALQVRCWLGDDVDYVLPGRTMGLAAPSRIVDLLQQKVLR